MKRNFQSILLIFIISSGLFAQGNVLQINSPTTGELVSTSFLPIDYSLAGYFDIGDSACADCDGFIRVTLNYAYASSFHGVGPDTLQDVTNGQYLLGLEAVNPTGESFDPQIMDTVTFLLLVIRNYVHRVVLLHMLEMVEMYYHGMNHFQLHQQTHFQPSRILQNITRDPLMLVHLLSPVKSKGMGVQTIVENLVGFVLAY